MNDILLTPDFDLSLVDGDLSIGSSTSQQPQLLLNTAPGEWRNAPTVGIGLVQYIEAADQAALARRIQTELSTDGMTINKISINNANIYIDGNY